MQRIKYGGHTNRRLLISRHFDSNQHTNLRNYNKNHVATNNHHHNIDSHVSTDSYRTYICKNGDMQIRRVYRSRSCDYASKKRYRSASNDTAYEFCKDMHQFSKNTNISKLFGRYKDYKPKGSYSCSNKQYYSNETFENPDEIRHGLSSKHKNAYQHIKSKEKHLRKDNWSSQRHFENRTNNNKRPHVTQNFSAQYNRKYFKVECQTKTYKKDDRFHKKSEQYLSQSCALSKSLKTQPSLNDTEHLSSSEEQFDPTITSTPMCALNILIQRPKYCNSANGSTEINKIMPTTENKKVVDAALTINAKQALTSYTINKKFKLFKCRNEINILERKLAEEKFIRRFRMYQERNG